MSSIKKPFSDGNKSQLKVSKLTQAYNQFQSTKISTDIVTFAAEAEHLKNYENEIKQIEIIIKQYKTDAEKSFSVLFQQEKEIETQEIKYRNIISEFQNSKDELKINLANYKNQYMKTIRNRIDIAKKEVKIHDLKKLDLEDRKAESNEVWKWILLVLYKQPVSKYYWGNFKQQIFQEDKGADFIQRLGKVSSIDTNEQERLVTEKLLAQRQKYLNHTDFAKVKSSIDALLNIAQLYQEGYQIAKKSKSAQSESLTENLKKVEKQEQLKKIQAKKAAIIERLNLNKKYVSLLVQLQRKLIQKQLIYATIESQGQRIIKDLKSMQKGTWVSNTQQTNQKNYNETNSSTKLNTKPGTFQSYNNQSEKRDECQCLIF